MNPRDDVMDFDPDAPDVAATPVPGKNTPSPVPEAPGSAPPPPSVPGTAIAEPGKEEAPSTSAKKRGGRSKLLSTVRSESDCARFVNLTRDLQRWANAADREERAGRDADLHPLRRLCVLKRKFLRLHRVNLAHPGVGAVANGFLRRRDMAGLRHAMRQIVLREIATAVLQLGRRNFQPPSSNVHQLN